MIKDYGMFTSEGAKLVQKLIDQVCAMPSSTTPQQMNMALAAGAKKIEEAGHEEVWDTDVREQATYEVEKITKRKLTIYWG